jgi:hypothetical protein
MKAKGLKASCKGAEVTLAPPYSGTAVASLGLPALDSTSHYCAAFGGAEARNDARKLKRRKSPAPPACPLAPGSFTGFRPDDVSTLADDALGGRQNGTLFSTSAQDYLMGELEPIASGLSPTPFPYLQEFDVGTNVLGIIPGSDLADEYVIVGAHYDHLGQNCRRVDPGDDICNGATDNAAGVSAVLAVGRQIAALATPPRRSVILAFWDAEEDGLLGSRHYVANPLVPLADTAAYVNFDLLGANLAPSLRDFSVAIGPETGGDVLSALVDAAIALEGLGTRSLSIVFGQGRSDHLPFNEAGIPIVFFGDSTGGCYHTTADEVDVVDFGKLERQAKIGYYAALGLAQADVRPPFPSGLPTATFADAVVIHDAMNRGIADIGLFPVAEQTALLAFQADLDAIVAEGEQRFELDDVARLLVGTITLVDTLTTLECDGFL